MNNLNKKALFLSIVSVLIFILFTILMCTFKTFGMIVFMFCMFSIMAFLLCLLGFSFYHLFLNIIENKKTNNK